MMNPHSLTVYWQGQNGTANNAPPLWRLIGTFALALVLGLAMAARWSVASQWRRFGIAAPIGVGALFVALVLWLRP